jgi:hypothetical protein
MENVQLTLLKESLYKQTVFKGVTVDPPVIRLSSPMMIADLGCSISDDTFWTEEKEFVELAKRLQYDVVWALSQRKNAWEILAKNCLPFDIQVTWGCGTVWHSKWIQPLCSRNILGLTHLASKMSLTKIVILQWLSVHGTSQRREVCKKVDMIWTTQSAMHNRWKALAKDGKIYRVKIVDRLHYHNITPDGLKVLDEISPTAPMLGILSKRTSDMVHYMRDHLNFKF